MSGAAVVILNWNGVHHLRRFLPSVVANTPAQVDIVVADNGSTDNSVEMLAKEFARVKIVQLDRNYGFAEGYNRAVAELDYEYLVLLNSDVEVTHGWVEPLLDELKCSEGVGAVAPKILSVERPDYFEHAGAAGGYIDYLGYPFCRGRILGYVERDEGQYDDAREVFWATGAAFACRGELFKRFGGFDSTFFAHMEEIDLCWRMQLSGYSIRYQPRSVVYHLGGGTLQTNSPRKIYLNHRNNLAMLLRCAPLGQLLLLIIMRPALDLLAAFSYIATHQIGGFMAVIKAYRDFFGSFGRLLSERRAVRSAVKQESKSVVRTSILLNYLLGKRKFA